MRKRPRSVTRLGFLVLIFTSWHLYSLISLLRDLSYLQSLPLQIPLAFLIGEAILWSGLGIGLLWTLRVHPKKFPRLFWISYLAYAFVRVTLDLMLKNSTLGRTNTQFEIGAITIFGAILFWIMSQPEVRHYFGVQDERQ